MEEKHIVLSERLHMLSRMVTPGNRVADVGCDHGFLSVYLVQKGISPKVIAMDVREGPLAAAEEHVAVRRLGAYIETRLSDGLKELKPEEADTVVCAGMGGRLMKRILTESMDKTMRLKELVLQPQSELQEFREFLRNTGFRIVDEDMVEEDGKFYFAMRVLTQSPTVVSQRDMPVDDPEDYLRLCDKFGQKLLLGRHPVLERYLRQQEKILEQLKEKLNVQGTERTEERLHEIVRDLKDVRLALGLF